MHTSRIKLEELQKDQKKLNLYQNGTINGN